MLRLNNTAREIMYDGKPVPKRRIFSEKWDVNAVIGDEHYEFNLRHLLYTYELYKNSGKLNNPMPREILVGDVIVEYDHEVRDAEQLKKIQSLADVWD